MTSLKIYCQCLFLIKLLNLEKVSSYHMTVMQLNINEMLSSNYCQFYMEIECQDFLQNYTQVFHLISPVIFNWCFSFSTSWVVIKILCYITGVNFCPHLVSQILGYWNVEGSYKGVTVMFSDAPSQGGGLKSYPELSVGRYIFIS